MARFLSIGERIHVISPVIRKALQERNPEPIIKRARTDQGRCKLPRCKHWTCR